MKFSFTLLKKLKPAGIKNVLTRANVIFTGALFLVIAFIIFIAVDAYLFFTVRTRESGTASPRASSVTLTSQDIDEAIKLIDQREQEYQALLNPK